MDFYSIRPIFTGLAGGAIAIWLGSRWQRRQPTEIQQSNADLLHSHRLTVYLASIFFFAGILAGIAMYTFGHFAKNDWRPLGLGVGGGCAAAVLILFLVPVIRGQSIKGAYAAFAISEKTSPLPIYFALGTGVLAFAWALVDSTT